MLKFGFGLGKKNAKKDESTMKKNEKKNTHLKYFDQLTVSDIHIFNLNDLIFENALHIAILNDNREKIDTLLQSRKNNINKKDSIKQYTPLHLAVYLNDIDLTNQILTIKNLNIDEKDADNKTALIIASMMGNSQIVQTLLNHKSSINCTDNIGCTALHYTILNNDRKSFNLILERKPNLNFIDKSGYSYLHHAILLKRYEMSKELIEAKINVNIVDKNDQIPLHHAYIQNQNTIVNLLLENGSYTRKTDLFGKIPSDYKNLNGNIKQESNSFESLNESEQYQLENTDEEYNESNYDDSSIISFESSQLTPKITDNKQNSKRKIKENNNENKKNKNSSNNNKDRKNSNKRNNITDDNYLTTNYKDNNIIDKLNQPIIKIISHKKKNNLVVPVDHNTHDNDNLTSDLSISTFSYSTNILNEDDDDIDKDTSYSSELWNEFSVLNKDKRILSNGNTLEESKMSVTAEIKHVLNDEYEESYNDLSLMDEDKQIPEILNVPQNVMDSIDYLHEKNSKNISAKLKAKNENSKKDPYIAKNKMKNINNKYKNSKSDDEDISDNSILEITDDDSFNIKKNEKNKNNKNKLSKTSDEISLSESSSLSIDDEEENTERNYKNKKDRDNRKNKRKEEEKINNIQIHEVHLSEDNNENDDSSIDFSSEIIMPDNSNMNNKDIHIEKNKSNRSSKKQSNNNRNYLKDNSEKYSTIKKNPISKILFNDDLGMDMKNKKTINHKEISYHKVINRDVNDNNKYIGETNYNEIDDNLSIPDDDSFSISDGNEYPNKIHNKKKYNINTNNKDDISLSEEIISNNDQELNSNDSNSLIKSKLEYEELKRKGLLLQNEIHKEEELLKNSKKDEENLKNILIGRFMNKNSTNLNDEVSKQSPNMNANMKNEISSNFDETEPLSTEINDSKITESVYIQKNEVDNTYSGNNENSELNKSKIIDSIGDIDITDHFENISNNLTNIIEECNQMSKEEIIKKLKIALDENNQMKEVHKNDIKKINELRNNVSKKLDDYYELYDKYQELLKRKPEDSSVSKKKEELNTESEFESLFNEDLTSKSMNYEESLKSQNKKLKLKIKHYENLLKDNSIEITEEDIKDIESVKDETDILSFSITNNKTYEVDDTIDILNNAINDKNEFIENLEKKVKEQQKIINDYEVIMEENSKEKRQYISNLTKDLDEANEKSQNLMEKINEYEFQMDEKNKENDELLEKITELEKKSKDSQNQYEDLDMKLEKTQNKLEELQNENNDLSSNLREANDNISYLKNEIKDLIEKKEDMTKELMNYQENNKYLNAELDECRMINENLTNKLKKYNEGNESLSTDLNESNELMDSSSLKTEEEEEEEEGDVREESENSTVDNEALFQRYSEKNIIELLEEFKSNPPQRIEEIYCLTSIIINQLENDLKISKQQLLEEINLRECISKKQNRNIKSINELEQSLSEIQNLYKEQMSINQENENKIKNLLKTLSYSSTQIEDIQNKLTNQQEKINSQKMIYEKTKALEQKNKDSQIQLNKLNKIIEDNQSKNAFIERKFDEFFKVFNEKLASYVKTFCEINIKETLEKKKDNYHVGVDEEDIKSIIKENSELKSKLEILSSNTNHFENHDKDDDDDESMNESKIMNTKEEYNSMSKDDVIDQLIVILGKYKDIKKQFGKLQVSYSNLEKTYEILQKTHNKHKEKLNENEQEKVNLLDRIQLLEDNLIKERNYSADYDHLKNEIISKDKELENSIHCINDMKRTLETITSNSHGIQKELDEKNSLINNYTQKINQLNNEIEMKNKSNEDIRISYETENTKKIKDIENLKAIQSNLTKELDTLKKQYNNLQDEYNQSIKDNSNSLLNAEKQKSEIELKMNAQINENAVLSAKNDSLESIIKKQEQDIEEISKKKEQLSVKFNDERLANEKLNGEIKKLMIEIEYGENERKNIYNSKTQIDIEYSTLKSEYDAVSQKLKEFQDENKRINQNHSEVERKAGKLNKQLEETNQKYIDLEAKYESIKTSFDQMSQENENLKNSLEDFLLLDKNDENDLKMLRAKSLDDIKDTKDYFKYSRTISKKIEKERDELKNKIDKMQATISDITNENDSIKKELSDSQTRLEELEKENDKIKKESESMYHQEKEKRDKEHKELNQNYNDSINEKDKEIKVLREFQMNSQIDMEKLKNELQRSKSDLEESQKRNKEMELSLNESLQKINILVNKESKSQTDIDFLNKDIEDREKKLQKQLEDIEEIKQEALKYKNQIKELKEQMDIIIDERNNLEQKLKLEIHENEVNLKIEKSKIKEYEKQMQNSNLKNDELIKDINDKYESLKKEYEELANTYNKQCSQINLIWKSLSPTEDIFDNKDLLSLKEYLENELSQKNSKINHLQQTCDCYQEQKENITKNYKNILQQFKDSSIKQIEEKCKENERLKKNLNEIKEEYDEKEKKLVKLFDEKVKEIAERLQQQTEERKKVEDMRDQQVNEMKENYVQKIQTLQQKIYSLKENLHTLKENNKQEKRELENFISNTNDNNSLSKCSSSQLSLIPSPSQLNLLDIEKGDLNHNKEKNTIKKPNSNTHQSCLSEVNENNLRELKLQKVFNSSLKLNIQPNSLNRSLSNEIQEMRQRLNKNSDNDSAIKRKYLLEKDSYYLLENNDMMEGFKTTDMLKKKLLEFETKYT